MHIKVLKKIMNLRKKLGKKKMLKNGGVVKYGGIKHLLFLLTNKIKVIQMIQSNNNKTRMVK